MALNFPEGYFEQLQKDVKGRLQEEEKSTPKGKVVPLLSRRWLSIAASVIILLSVGAYYWQTNPSTILPAEPSNLELANYIQENLDDFELELLSKYAFAEDEPKFDLLPEDDPFESEEMDELIDDLIDEMDLSTLEELL